MKKMLPGSLFSLAAILLAGPALAAADLGWGLQLSLAAPVGDLKTLANNSTGGDLKGFCLVDLGKGSTIRPQIDALSFSGKPSTVPTPYGTLQMNGASATATMASLGADYLYFLAGDPTQAGVYGGGGVDLSVNTVKLSNSSNSVSSTASKAAYSLVLGYQFNAHWNVEGSYRYSNWSTSDWTLSGQPLNISYTLPTYLVGAGYRF
jgi:opacity protein-like surface antigen